MEQVRRGPTVAVITRRPGSLDMITKDRPRRVCCMATSISQVERQPSRLGKTSWSENSAARFAMSISHVHQRRRWAAGSMRRNSRLGCSTHSRSVIRSAAEKQARLSHKVERRAVFSAATTGVVEKLWSPLQAPHRRSRIRFRLRTQDCPVANAACQSVRDAHARVKEARR